MTALVVDAHVTLGRIDDVDVRAEDLIAQMDRAGVDIAVISPDPQQTAVAHRAGHDQLRSVCARYPTRLRWYATANPWGGDEAVAELERALADGAAAIKFNPSLQGFQPIQAIIDPLLEVARTHRVPVYVHTGTPVQSTPFQVSALARRFPDVAFILGRAGKSDFKADALAALRERPNLYGDTAHDFPLTGMAAQAAAAPGRVVFSSDYPFGDMLHELRRTRAMPVSAEVLAGVLGAHFWQLLPEHVRTADGTQR